MQFDLKEIFRSSWAVFIIYVISGALLILGFRAIFPGEASPLPVFSHDWRLIQGLLTIIALYPALALSALVVPFGIVSNEDYYTTFSPRFFQRLIAPLITAICGAALYALLFFLILPLAQDYEENLRFKGETFRLAKERAQAHAEAGEWLEASQLIGICDRMWPDNQDLRKWPGNQDLSDLRAEIEVKLEDLRFAEEDAQYNTAAELHGAAVAIPEQPGDKTPLDATEAITLSQAAFNKGNFFDAHWLATVGERLARPGTPEVTLAAELAARAWNRIESQQPTPSEEHLYAIYRFKRSGYEAMVSGDWIRAFYIFQELVGMDPYDPDAANFLAVSEQGTREVAFFIDEMELSPGETLTGVIFSLPAVQGGERGRSVMRVSSLSATPDYAYGRDIEYMVFDDNARLLLSLQAPYAKFLPITLDGERRVSVLMRALDRHDSSRRWEPEWTGEDNVVYHSGSAQIVLDPDYETFIIISEMRQRMPSLQMGELFTATTLAGNMGYIPQIFEAEILNRLGSCLFFLPMSILAIIIGWRFRARQRPRYFFVLLLPILPVVFNALVYSYRIVFNTAGISLILGLGFSLALPVLITVLAVIFVLSLILLAAQHG